MSNDLSENFGKLPSDAEAVGTIPKSSEGFGSVPNLAERKASHTLTVREVARMFEAAGVARTERSIINWCQPNRLGVPRLDSYFDPNERKYFITLQSVELAIQEEQAKAAQNGVPSEPAGSLPKVSEIPSHEEPQNTATGTQKALEQELMDLKITNRGKDYFIEQLKQERGAFAEERQVFVDKLITFTRKVGELETKLLQLDFPKSGRSMNGNPEHVSEESDAEAQREDGGATLAREL